jgi:hypothetical protein
MFRDIQKWSHRKELRSERDVISYIKGGEREREILIQVRQNMFNFAAF